MINLLIADDSDVIKKILKNEIEKEASDIKVLDFAKNGIEAYDKTFSLKPDIVIMDIKMPYLSGIDATKKIIKEQLTPVIIFSSLNKNDSELIELLKYPNVSFLEKPKGFNYSESIKELISKIKSVFKPKTSISIKNKLIRENIFKPSIICIGASTGGTDIIASILKELDNSVKVPILIIQHITEGFNIKFANWLKEYTTKEIKVVSLKEDIEENCIYIPDNNSHLLISPDKKIYSSKEKLHQTFCPSVDVTFNSVSEVFREKTMGIILTGMGKDGAEGIYKIFNYGGYTIAQNEESCIVFGMPKAAIEKNAVKKIINYKEIPSIILEACLNGLKN
ncbi:MAG: chemotaxis protein CheB [Candidatus Sericytochromatia bacterium]